LPRPQSLTARLVLTVVALVVGITMLVGAAAALGIRAYLTEQLDDQVVAALARAQQGSAFESQVPPLIPESDSQRDDGAGDGDGDGRGDRGDIEDRRGQGVGTLTAVFPAGSSAGYGDVIVQQRDGRTSRPSLNEEALAALAALPAHGRPRTVRLDGLGEYRVAVAGDGLGKVAAGLPTADVRDVVSNLLAWQAGLIVVGTCLGTVGGFLLIRRQLRPLREVAATAHIVADLPLAEGEIDLDQRVPDHLTDERTEVGQVGAALNTLLAHVESSLQARHRSEQHVRQFVADASHELRTPLATIAGYSELARRHPDDEVALRTALAKVDEESSRMTSLVEDLLLLARLDSGRPLVQEPVDLVHLLVEAVSDAQVLAPDHRWRLDLPQATVEVLGDEQRLHQVVMNLLTNARKYTPAGTTVTITAQASGFVVHDDGPGFPASFAAKAFERFTRHDAARTRTGGVGLGLALVQAIVAAHGGRVDLDSRPGSTTFTVRFPKSIGKP
jgi:two-component system, OmpR family, sensor kinase